MGGGFLSFLPPGMALDKEAKFSSQLSWLTLYQHTSGGERSWRARLQLDCNVWKNTALYSRSDESHGKDVGRRVVQSGADVRMLTPGDEGPRVEARSNWEARGAVQV